MLQARFLDGSPVTAAYLEQISRLVSAACVAEEMFDVDELEQASGMFNTAEIVESMELERICKNGMSPAFSQMEIARTPYLQNLHALRVI